ncbi:putative lipid II flippase FtsW [Pseudomaricurvus sp. HS19]|uniref:putative lipid II flippase FtsW n=1 Tax=Pseudomaricurvus sp. HS19 TaxID=2692626 RepID=UPI0013697536|nr:putative lipid II flippase FtsW [Pseudomaricurvus sp. HS19]MYM64687.1 putative lipid II flippase FtsW [Pseudomaricurvus sp. HS19]
MKRLSFARPVLNHEAVNWHLLLWVMVLSSFGLVMVTSASMATAETYYGDSWFFAKRYATYWTMGLSAALLIAMVPVSVWEKHGGLFLIAALVLLTLVLIPGIGRKVNGSQRWLQLGPLALQASEVVKFCAIIFYASFLARRGAEMLADWRGVLKPLLTLALLVFLLLLEPDFGASVVLAGTVMAMLFVAGVRMWQFLLLFVAAVGGLGLIATLSPYRMQRLITFLDPWADQYNSGYQLTQSLIAFGRGEWLGQGLGNSLQKLFYLPEAHTDFIFAIVAEEFGLLGVACILAVFIGMVICVLNISQRAMKQGANYISFATFGVAVMFAAQAFINLGVASGLLPTKGLTMPFISYGGSSLLVTMMLVGLVMRADYDLHTRMAKAQQQTLARADKAARSARGSSRTPLLTDVVEAA